MALHSQQPHFSKSRTLFWRSIIHSINTFPEYLPQARHHHSYRYSGYILKTKERKPLALRELAFLVWRDSKLASENCNMSDDAEIVKVWINQLCLTLCNPMECSLPGSSVHGISQARILEWVAICFSRGISKPRVPTHISCVGRRILYHTATWKANI